MNTNTKKLMTSRKVNDKSSHTYEELDDIRAVFLQQLNEF
jgi:hypothetical protein